MAKEHFPAIQEQFDDDLCIFQHDWAKVITVQFWIHGLETPQIITSRTCGQAENYKFCRGTSPERLSISRDLAQKWMCSMQEWTGEVIKKMGQYLKCCLFLTNYVFSNKNTLNEWNAQKEVFSISWKHEKWIDVRILK